MTIHAFMDTAPGHSAGARNARKTQEDSGERARVDFGSTAGYITCASGAFCTTGVRRRFTHATGGYTVKPLSLCWLVLVSLPWHQSPGQIVSTRTSFPPEPRSVLSGMERLPSTLPVGLRPPLVRRDARLADPPFGVGEANFSLAGSREDHPDASISAPSARKITAMTTGSRFVIDTATVYAIADTTRRIFSFNANSLMTVERFQKYAGGTWIDTRRLTYSYDDRDHMIGSLHEIRINGTLQPDSRETYVYDARGNPAADLREVRDSVTNTLVLSNRSIFLYDAHGNPLLEQYEAVTTGTIQRGTRLTYARDAAGNELHYCEETWKGGWAPSSRRTITRDGQGHPLSEITQRQQNGDWVNGMKKEYTYDTRGNLLIETREYWWDGAWLPSTRDTWVYDVQDSVILAAREVGFGGAYQNGERYILSYEMGRFRSGRMEEWTDNAWVPYHRWTVDYNSVGDPIVTTGWWWDGRNWTFSSQRRSTYDAARRLTEEFTEYWQEGRWMGGGRATWAFDGRGDPTITQYMSIDSLGETIYGYREMTAYDQQGMPARLTYEAWADGGWQPADQSWAIHDSSNGMPSPFNRSTHNEYVFTGYRVELRSSAIGPDPAGPLSILLLQNYPNPFNAGTVITYSLPVSGIVRLAVFDLLGREVARLVDGPQGPGTFTARFEATQLPSGVYFYRLHAGAFAETKRMLHLR